jgi:hypothetical protein
MIAVPFDVNDAGLRREFLRRTVPEVLAGLREDAEPSWGRMAAPQMVEHLLWAMELSTGRAETTCPVPEARREQAKAFLYDARPTPRDFANPVLTAGLPPLRCASLAEARAALAAETERFAAQAAAAPDAKRMHPVFGPIGPEEWERAHFKHAYHHLVQFGLIASERRAPGA